MPESTRIEDIDSSRRLQLLIDGVIDYALYLIGPDGRVLTWNSGAQRLKGYAASEILGQPFASFFTPEDRQRGVPGNALATAAAEGRFESEGWRVRKDGTRFWAMGVIDAIYNDRGTLIGFAKITRDMTDRRLAHERLQEAEQSFRRLVDAVIDYAIFQLDVNGYITTWNSGAQRIKGYTADEIIGRHFSHFYTQEDRDSKKPERALRTAETQGKFDDEGWRVRKDGTKFWASVIIDPIRGEHGNLLGYAKVTRDVTERREAQRALNEAQEQLATAQRMEAIGQLSGGIAHDFNNFLMIVLGNLETAQRNARNIPGTENIVRNIKNAIRGAQRASALTSRLLAFSRRQPLDPKPLDVNRFLNAAVEFLQRSLGEHIEIEVVGSAGLWQVEVDANHLEAALINLSINARDAMPKGGKLTLEAANVFVDEEYCRINPELTPGQFVVICVSDTGTGMTPDTMSRAFEPFFTTKEAGHGTGLGLSQVYGFVKQSGGHIKIYSEVGQGTTVKIYMPRLVFQGEQEATNNEAPGTGETGEAVLVVEDEPDLRLYLAEVLRGLGYRVLTAQNAEFALKLISNLETRIDLLLTDIVMPGANGRELAAMAHKIRPRLPVLYMTGYSRNAVIHQGRLDEGVQLLQKPVTQAELAARVRNILDQKK